MSRHLRCLRLVQTDPDCHSRRTPFARPALLSTAGDLTYNVTVTDALHAENERLQWMFDRLPDFIASMQRGTRLELWHETVLGCILVRLRTNFRHLSTAYRMLYEPEYLAWATRNVFELAIWAKYATSSKENARKLHSDHVIDLAELQKGMAGLLQKYLPDDPALELLKAQEEWLRQTKSELGRGEEETHLNIGAIARDLDMGPVFYGLNRVLSKLVHPTSFSIMLNMDSSTEAQTRRALFALGQTSVGIALQTMVEYFESAGINSSLLR
jgi:hypothetical protein